MLKKFDYEKMPIVEVVNEILVDASKRGASDIHFDPQEGFMKIRIRIDGTLMDYSEVPNSVRKNLITRIKIISGMNITESRLPQDGAIKATLQNVNLDLRVSALPTMDGEKIVIRILDYSMSSHGLESLGFSKSNYEKVVKMISSPNGIILVTGATGTGKSTTVYSILQRLNKEDTNIITVEDPIEMNITGINQVQTNSEIGLTFASALRSILRQDPNIIMIGEIRDSETARIAVRASITGHLVLSTIHTNSSLNTIERLLDMDVERYLLSSALTGIISQRLARRLCPNCREKRKTNDYEKNLFKKILDKDVDEIYTTVGCDECRNGYKGRIAVHEVLLIDQKIKDAISSNIRKEKLRDLVYSADVITLLQDGLEKVIAGETTFEELLKIIELENDEASKNGDYSLNEAIDMTHLTRRTNIDKETNETVNDLKTEDLFNEEPIISEKENKIEENEPVIETVDYNEIPIENQFDTEIETENNIEENENPIEENNIEELNNSDIKTDLSFENNVVEDSPTSKDEEDNDDIATDFIDIDKKENKKEKKSLFKKMFSSKKEDNNVELNNNEENIEQNNIIMDNQDLEENFDQTNNDSTLEVDETTNTNETENIEFDDNFNIEPISVQNDQNLDNIETIDLNTEKEEDNDLFNSNKKGVYSNEYDDFDLNFDSEKSYDEELDDLLDKINRD